jgi:1-deoxy-D-xylulose-5-phosphate synthase
VVAVIGDGSLVGGLALEGLHQGGHMGSDLIVLLNDNEMGISHNYSSLARYLRRVRTDPVYRHTRQHLEDVFKRLPGGELVIEAGHKLRAGVKHMVVPGMWFEELGYHYMGPVNGHSLPEMTAALKTARSLGGPVLIHCVTPRAKATRKPKPLRARSSGTPPRPPTSSWCQRRNRSRRAHSAAELHQRLREYSD